MDLYLSFKKNPRSIRHFYPTNLVFGKWEQGPQNRPTDFEIMTTKWGARWYLLLKHATACETGPAAEWTVLSQSIYPYLAKKKNLSRFRYFFIEKINLKIWKSGFCKKSKTWKISIKQKLKFFIEILDFPKINFFKFPKLFFSVKKYRNRFRFIFLDRYGYILCDKTVCRAAGQL